MQKVKKAAAQLDSRAAVSVLNNLKIIKLWLKTTIFFASFTKKQLLARTVALRRFSLTAHSL